MIYILIILSFLIESSVTRLVSSNSLFIPLFLLTSLTILYPYFKDKFSFVIISIVCGLFYDILNDTNFINTILFGIISGIIIFLYNYAKYNIYTSGFINILNIIIYRGLTYILLVIIDYIKFDYNILFKSIYSSLIINIIYGIILYLTSKVIYKLFKLKKN